MHNLRTIHGHSKVSKRQLIAKETMEFYVPLAKRLGEAAAELKERSNVQITRQTNFGL